MRRKPTRFAALGLVTLGAFACSGQDGSSAQLSLVRSSPEFASKDCPSGGHKLESGTDSNGNAKLDDSEVTSSSSVCDGAVGSAGDAVTGKAGKAGGSRGVTAVKVTDEPSGAACSTGGQRIDIGVDANADGKIDVGASVETLYVCDGEAGAP